MGIFANVTFFVVPPAGIASGYIGPFTNADTSLVSNLYTVSADTAFSGGYGLATASQNVVACPLKRVPAVRFAQGDTEDSPLTAAAGPPEAGIFLDSEHVRAHESLLAARFGPQTALVLVPGREGIAKINSISGEDLNCKYIALEITGQEGRRGIEIIVLRSDCWHHGVAQVISEAGQGKVAPRVVAAGQIAVFEEDKIIFRDGKSGGYPTERNRILSPDDIDVTDPLPHADIAGVSVLDEILAGYFHGFKIESF